MKIIEFDQLYAETGIRLGKRQLSRLEAAGKFPRRVQISSRRWGYFASEIAEHLAALADSRTTSPKMKEAEPCA